MRVGLGKIKSCSHLDNITAHNFVISKATTRNHNCTYKTNTTFTMPGNVEFVEDGSSWMTTRLPIIYMEANAEDKEFQGLPTVAQKCVELYGYGSTPP